MHAVYKMPKHDRRPAWRAIIQAWRNSDLTQAKYCEQEQLKLADFKRWHYKLRKQSKRVTSTQVHVDKSLQFVPLQLAAPNQATAEKNQGSINLYIEERYRLSCSSPLDETLLATVLGVLRRLSC